MNLTDLTIPIWLMTISSLTIAIILVYVINKTKTNCNKFCETIKNIENSFITLAGNQENIANINQLLTIKNEYEKLLHTQEIIAMMTEKIVPEIEKWTEKMKTAEIFQPDFTKIKLDNDNNEVIPQFARDINLEDDMIISNYMRHSKHLINQLQNFAIYFTHNTVDKNIAFPAVAETYCTCITRLMPIIFPLYKKYAVYTDIIQLFYTWSKKMSEKEIINMLSEKNANNKNQPTAE